MSDPTVKGVKRPLSGPASRRGAATSLAKSRTISGKSSRPTLTIKRSLAGKAPARKATKANGAGATKSKTSKLAKSSKPVARPKAKPTKSTIRTKPKASRSTSRSKTKPPLRSKTKSPVRAKAKSPKTPVKSKPKSTKLTTRTKAKALKSSIRIKKSPKKISSTKKASSSKRSAKQKPKASLRKPLRAKVSKPKSQKASAKSRVTKKINRTKSSALALPKHSPASPPVPRQPTRDEAAALRAFEKAHKEFSRGRFSEAGSMFRALVEKHPGASEVAARARTYLAIAESRMRTELSLPRDADSLYDRGVIELNRGEYVAAQEMFERALKREPEAAHIHYGLAATRARLGSIESALTSLQNALDLQPNLRVRAQHDHDLSTLRNDPVFDQLIFSPRV